LVLVVLVVLLEHPIVRVVQLESLVVTQQLQAMELYLRLLAELVEGEGLLVLLLERYLPFHQQEF
jgi:hypothetical protein